MFNFLGWLVGVFVGVVLVLVIFVSLALPIPALVGFLAAILAAVTAVVGTLTPILTPAGVVTFAIVLLIAFYLWAYAFATASLGPALATLGAPTLPAAPAGLPAVPGELFARGYSIGLTATFNAALLSLVPVFGPFLAVWAFAIVSLAAVILVARNLIFQGFLGWSAWLFPMSYVATVFGLIVFVANPIFAGITSTPFSIRTDWTTGVIETRGALNVGPVGFAGGFSLGNFTFLTPGIALGAFTAPNIPSHEVGHSLNTAAMGGVVLWINAVDENIFPRRLTLAYGELLAESRAQAMTGPTRARFFVRIWG